MKILNTPYPAIGILMLTAATLTACIKDASRGTGRYPHGYAHLHR